MATRIFVFFPPLPSRNTEHSKTEKKKKKQTSTFNPMTKIRINKYSVVCAFE